MSVASESATASAPPWESPESQEAVLQNPGLAPFFDNLESFVELPEGVEKLRGLVMDLAVSGQLVPPDSSDEPADVLLEKLAARREKLIADGKLKESRSVDVDDDAVALTIASHWRWARLSDLVEVMNSGWSPACEPNPTRDESEWGVLKTTSVQSFRFLQNEHKRLPDKLEPRPEAEAKRGDLLMTRAGPQNRVGVSCLVRDVRRRLMISDKIIRFHLIEPFMFDEFVALCLNAGISQQHIEKSKSGMAASQMNISQSKFRMTPIPVPPLAEQRRIVSKVEGLMSLCDTLESHRRARESVRERASRSVLASLTIAPRVRSQVSGEETLASAWQRLSDHFEVLLDQPLTVPHLRQSILQLAVQGKLVPQAPSDEPVSDVLDLIHADNEETENKRSRPAMVVSSEALCDVPKSWSWVRLGELLEPQRDISYGVIKLGKEPKAGGVTCLRCSDVRYRVVTFDRARRISEELSGEYARTILRGGELLMNIRGTLGGCGIVPAECRGFNIAREVAIIPLSEHLNSEFVLGVISSPLIQQATDDSLRGIAYKGLNLGLLREFPIPLPPKAEQKRIVSKVSVLLSQCDELSARLRSRQSTTDALLTALIHQILEGTK